MKLIVSIFYLAVMTSSAAHAQTTQVTKLQGIVTQVSDGDTLWIKTQTLSKPIKVRLQGVDAPELCQPWGREASAALRNKLLRQNVMLETLAQDDYQRTLGRVEHGGQDVGRWLVSNGHAWSYGYRRSSGVYAKEQAAAQAQRVGLWRQAGALEPRAFRKQHGPCKH